MPGHGRCSGNGSWRNGLLFNQHLPHLISLLPPQPPGPIQLQPCQEKLPSRPGRVLDAGPEVRLRPGRPAILQSLSLRRPLRRPVAGHCPGSLFWGQSSIEGDRENPGEQGWAWFWVSQGCPRGGGWRTAWVYMLLLYLPPLPRVPYLAVARTFEKIEEVSAR